jgi:hypothetical protein
LLAHGEHRRHGLFGVLPSSDAAARAALDAVHQRLVGVLLLARDLVGQPVALGLGGAQFLNPRGGRFLLGAQAR